MLAPLQPWGSLHPARQEYLTTEEAIQRDLRGSRPFPRAESIGQDPNGPDRSNRNPNSKDPVYGGLGGRRTKRKKHRKRTSKKYRPKSRKRRLTRSGRRRSARL